MITELPSSAVSTKPLSLATVSSPSGKERLTFIVFCVRLTAEVITGHISAVKSYTADSPLMTIALFVTVKSIA